jgi:hypothetical protein
MDFYTETPEAPEDLIVIAEAKHAAVEHGNVIHRDASGACLDCA